MLAFLKRRWILLSCTVVLLMCSVVVAGKVFHPTADSNDLTAFIIHRGNLHFIHGDFFRAPEVVGDEFPAMTDEDYWMIMAIPPGWRFAAPSKGDLPRFAWKDGCVSGRLPVWLLGAAVVGWLVIRELRWREKRARAKEAAAPQ